MPFFRNVLCVRAAVSLLLILCFCVLDSLSIVSYLSCLVMGCVEISKPNTQQSNKPQIVTVLCLTESRSCVKISVAVLYVILHVARQMKDRQLHEHHRPRNYTNNKILPHSKSV